MIETTDINLSSRIATAVSRLMVPRVDGNQARLSVPVLYPSGAGAAVEITMNGGNCFVSDLAHGQSEAEMQGASSFYGDAARRSAKRFGVDYDGMSIFAIWASIDNIEAAIMSVANASVFAASSAIFKALEEKDRKRNQELFDKVTRIFGRREVSREEEVAGQHEIWPAHNVVTLQSGGKAVFEFVSSHPNSISSKYTMFSDLSKSPNRYALNSVVKSLEKFGGKGLMLQDVSNVMVLGANDDEYRKMAIAS